MERHSKLRLVMEAKRGPAQMHDLSHYLPLPGFWAVEGWQLVENDEVEAYFSVGVRPHFVLVIRMLTGKGATGARAYVLDSLQAVLDTAAKTITARDRNRLLDALTPYKMTGHI